MIIRNVLIDMKSELTSALLNSKNHVLLGKFEMATKIKKSLQKNMTQKQRKQFHVDFEDIKEILLEIENEIELQNEREKWKHAELQNELDMYRAIEENNRK